jgi:hypothetical protein
MQVYYNALKKESLVGKMGHSMLSDMYFFLYFYFLLLIDLKLNYDSVLITINVVKRTNKIKTKRKKHHTKIKQQVRVGLL